MKSFHCRSKTLASIEPLQINELTQKLGSASLEKPALKDTNYFKSHQPTKKEKEELKTWHHLPVYPYTSAVNKTAVFIQPWKNYQQYFSIHPEWGVHNPVNMIKS